MFKPQFFFFFSRGLVSWGKTEVFVGCIASVPLDALKLRGVQRMSWLGGGRRQVRREHSATSVT